MIPSIGNVYIQLAESHSLWKRQKIDGPKVNMKLRIQALVFVGVVAHWCNPLTSQSEQSGRQGSICGRAP